MGTRYEATLLATGDEDQIDRLMHGGDLLALMEASVPAGYDAWDTGVTAGRRDMQVAYANPESARRAWRCICNALRGCGMGWRAELWELVQVDDEPEYWQPERRLERDGEGEVA